MTTAPYWHKQEPDKPLFPELLWSRPEHKKQAGKLLVVGGNLHGFSDPAEAYAAAEKAGAGSVRVVLPEALRHTVGKLFPAAEFAPSTPSGSFGRPALAELLEASAWSDGILLAGDIGRNSETAVLLESFLEKQGGQVTITRDAADFFCREPTDILQRPDTLLVVAMGQLRELGMSVKFPLGLTSDLGLVQLVDRLHEFTRRYAPLIITRHQDHFIVATNGQVSTTSVPTPEQEQAVWRAATAAQAAVWWLQNPTKPFEALTTAVCTDRQSVA